MTTSAALISEIQPAKEPCSLPFVRYLPRSGHPDWGRLHREAVTLARRILPTLAEPDQGVEKWRRRAASYQTAVSNYRENRRRTRANRWDLLPLYFIWTTSRKCNFSCEYCDDHRGSKYPDLCNDGVLDTSGACRMLKTMRTGTPAVYFAGGEPTLRKDLPEITRYTKSINYYPILINTNASLIHRCLERPSWRTWLADTDVVIVSLDGLERAAMGEMWGTRHPDDVFRNLLLLRQLAEPMQIKLMVNTVIQPGRIQWAKDVLDLANDLGIWFCPVPMNKGATIDAALSADPEYEGMAKLILDRKREGYRISGSSRMNERLLRSAPLDCRNTLKPHIDFDGRLFWPCKACVNVPPSMINVLDFETIDQIYAHASKQIEPTRFHGPAQNQCGASCNWAQNYSTDTYVHGLQHPKHLVGEIAEFLRAR